MSIKASVIRILLLTLILFSGHASANTMKAQVFFVDILYLQTGKTVDDAREYFEVIEPLVAIHGLKRSSLGFEIVNAMQGDKNLDLVNVWTVADAEKTFKNIFSDPAYKKHIPLRDSIFDMKNSMMFLAKDANF